MKKVRQPPYLKKYEKDYAKMVTYMVEQVEQRFLNQTLGELNKGTIEKFSDAQIGNYSAVFLKLSKRTKRKLLKQFSDDRIEKFTRDVLSKVDRYNKDQFYSKLEGAIGISQQQLVAQEAMKATTNALVLETAQWAKKLRDDTLEFFTANTLRMMALGTDYETILSEFKKTGKEKRNHAQFIARNQIASFNSISSKIRAQNVGITQAIWRTSKDERVRRCHAVREGKQYDLSEGLYSSCDGKTLQVGTDYNCRCYAEFIIDGVNDGEQ